MDKLFNKIQTASVLAGMAVFSLASCVNEEYDISEELDLNVQVLQNTSIPLGNTESIAINTLLGDTADGSSLFNVSDNGDMSLSFGHESLSQTFEVPELALDGKGGISINSMTAYLSIADKYTSLPANKLSEVLAAAGADRIYCSSIIEGGSEVDGINEYSPFNIDKELPESVLSIRSLNMDKAKLTFVFSVTEGAYMHLEKGFVIEFPAYLTLSADEGGLSYEILDGHKVVFTKDAMISFNNPLLLDMKFSSLSELEGMVNEKKNEAGEMMRYITTEDCINAYGKVYILPSDYGDAYIPKSPNVMMDINMSGLSMTSAELMVNMDLDIEDRNIQIGELPELFSSNDVVVDLYNPVLRFKINNSSPLQLNLNAEITSKTAAQTTDIHIGNVCQNGHKLTDPVVIPSSDEVVYYFSRQGKHGANDGADVMLDKLGDIIKQMPESLSIHDVYVEAERKFITIHAGQKYDVNLEFDFSADMAFGKDLKMGFDYDINLGLETGAIGLDNLVLSMNMCNSIPLDLNVKGVALDENGNEIQSTSLDITLKAGTLENPVTTPAEISLSASGSDSTVSKLRLKITASSNEQIQGNVLNVNQGLSINDLSIALPEGVNLYLNEIF